MTIEEIFSEYKDLFIMIMTSVGQDINNSVYEDVKNSLESESSEKIMSQIISQDPPLEVYIAGLISLMILRNRNPKDLPKKVLDRMGKIINNIFDKYLFKPTRYFTSKNGLPSINKLYVDVRLILV